MALSYIGTTATIRTSAALPAHQAGDLILGFAYRESNTPPSAPTGSWITIDALGANTNSFRFCYKVAQSSSELSQVWANSEELQISIYRGINPSGAKIGPTALSANTGTTVGYAPLTLRDPGKSWVVAFIGHRSTDTSLETPPGGLTLRGGVVGGGEERGFDSAGVATACPERTVAVGGTGAYWRSVVAEILNGTPYSATGTQGTQAISRAHENVNFNSIRSRIIAGIDSAQSEATGWDALRSNIAASAVARTSDTVVTITLPPLPTYDITAQETLTVTVPGVALAGAAAIVGSPTFTVDEVVEGQHDYTGLAGVGAISYGSSVVKSRGKAPVLGASVALTSGLVKARGKAPDVGGSIAYSESTRLSKGKTPFIGGSVCYDAGVLLSKGKKPSLGGSLSYSAEALRARGKYPEVGGSISYESGLIRSKGKVPTVGGSVAYDSSSVAINATLFLYTGSGTQAYDSGSAYYKTAEGGTQRIYVGTGVLVFDGGATRSVGKVYEAGGSLHFDGGTIYVLTSAGPTERAYTGTGSYSFQSGTVLAKGKTYSGLPEGTLVFSDAVVVEYTPYVYVYSRANESIPGYAGSLESKPSLTAYQQEALPGRPAGQDGVWTLPEYDGAVTEPPVDGAYTDVGYFKEFKPWWQNYTKEDAPSNEMAVRGAYTVIGIRGARTSPPARGAMTQSTTYTKEQKPN